MPPSAQSRYNVGDIVEDFAVLDSTRTGQLANLAARGLVPSGEPLVAGFVLGGNRARTLLIRGGGRNWRTLECREPWSIPLSRSQAVASSL